MFLTCIGVWLWLLHILFVRYPCVKAFVVLYSEHFCEASYLKESQALMEKDNHKK